MHPRVSPARPHELRSALEQLFARRPASERDRLVERGLGVFASGSEADSGLFVTHNARKRVTGAVLVQVLPGALGVAWPPVAGSPEAEDALAVALREWLRGRGVKVCQAFALPDQRPEVAALERAGFRYTTQVALLERETTPLDRATPDDWLGGTFYHPALREPFVATLLATHEGTLDCPELNGTRTPEELVAGFEFPDRASNWHFLAERDGNPAGVVLLEPDSDNQRVEIAYLGVVPEARGTGLGNRLVRMVLAEAARLGWAVTLTVDVRNEPALKLYARHGFTETERRAVFLAHM